MISSEALPSVLEKLVECVYIYIYIIRNLIQYNET